MISLPWALVCLSYLEGLELSENLKKCDRWWSFYQFLFCIKLLTTYLSIYLFPENFDQFPSHFYQQHLLLKATLFFNHLVKLLICFSVSLFNVSWLWDVFVQHVQRVGTIVGTIWNGRGGLIRWAFLNLSRHDLLFQYSAIVVYI